MDNASQKMRRRVFSTEPLSIIPLSTPRAPLYIYRLFDYLLVDNTMARALSKKDKEKKVCRYRKDRSMWSGQSTHPTTASQHTATNVDPQNGLDSLRFYSVHHDLNTQKTVIQNGLYPPPPAWGHLHGYYITTSQVSTSTLHHWFRLTSVHRPPFGKKSKNLKSILIAQINTTRFNYNLSS